MLRGHGQCNESVCNPHHPKEIIILSLLHNSPPALPCAGALSAVAYMEIATIYKVVIDN